MADYKIPAKFTDRITFLLEPGMKQELAELAFKKGLPLAEYLRTVLQKELDKNPRAKLAQTRHCLSVGVHLKNSLAWQR